MMSMNQHAETSAATSKKIRRKFYEVFQNLLRTYGEYFCMLKCSLLHVASKPITCTCTPY